MTMTPPTEDDVREHAGGSMQIGEVAERTGLTPRTLRYWEEIGLLPPAERLEGGFRLYSQADVERLQRIVELKKLLGFSLTEIRRIVETEETLRALRARNKIETDPAELRARIARAIEILQEQSALLTSHIEQMQSMRERYRERVERLRERLVRVAEIPAAASAESARGRDTDG